MLANLTRFRVICNLICVTKLLNMCPARQQKYCKRVQFQFKPNSNKILAILMDLIHIILGFFVLFSKRAVVVFAVKIFGRGMFFL